MTQEEADQVFYRKLAALLERRIALIFARWRTPKRLLVVSADADRRERWARVFADTGYDITRCAGPGASCAILQGRRCSLLAEADIALYERASFAPPIARALGGRQPYDAVVLVAEDDAAGRPSAVRRAGRSGTACFGTTL